jgi:FtsH-binding integral membrane protein
LTKPTLQKRISKKGTLNINYAHIHLIFNHIPVIGVVFTTLLLIVALARKSNELIMVALGFTILLSLATVPVYLTGPLAEGVLEDLHLPGISKERIEAHEEKAEIAFISIEFSGALAIITLIIRRYSSKLGSMMIVLILLALIISGGLVAWTADLGGKIHHQEIRSDTSFTNSH